MTPTIVTLIAQETPPVLVYWDSIHMEDIVITDFRSITNFPDKGNLIAINEQEGIVQPGSVLIGLLDLKWGEIKKEMDIHRVAALISASLPDALSDAFCVTGREDFPTSRVRSDFYGIRFDKVTQYSDGSYATLAHLLVIDQERVILLF